QRVEERALAGVGVSDDGDDGDAAAVALAPAGRAVAGKAVDARFQRRDPVADAAAINLQLGLAGSAAANPSGQAGQRVAAADQPRQQVLELGELDLELAVGALRPLREDVEDE